MVSTPSVRSAALTAAPMQVEQVSGNTLTSASFASPAQVFKPGRKPNPSTDRNQIAKPWQVEAYRHVNICGEARYAVSLFAAMAGRAELGIGEPQALRSKATWINSGPEVDALAEVVPTVRDRTKMIRDFMLHRKIAGECYLIARERVDTDPGYIAPPNPKMTWDEWIASRVENIDPLNYDPATADDQNPNEPIWEIVGVTELRKVGQNWEVRHDNAHWLELAEDDPVIRMWDADPANRREAWSPFRSMLPTLAEIEWLTKHIFTQVRSRLMLGGVWFLPENLTFPSPPDDSVEGGAEAIASMNEAERFLVSLATASMELLDGDEVQFPSVVMADAAALASIDKGKLINFWSEIDDKAMTLRSDAIRRFALGFDMPPEQALGAAAISRGESGGSATATNHWGEWAKEEQTIQNHIEPALDDFTGVLTTTVLRLAVPKTLLVVAYDTSGLRSRQDRSKEALELNARGMLNAARTLRETGFDPDHDLMEEPEFKRWLLVKMLGSGSPTPEQSQAILELLGTILPAVPALPGSDGPTKEQSGRNLPGNTDGMEVHGPPEGDHVHQEAPYSALHAACEVLVLRAMEKAGNRLLNEGKRGKDRDRTTPLHLAHIGMDRRKTYIGRDFDFGLATTVLTPEMTSVPRVVADCLARFCADLYNSGQPYTREAMLEAVNA